MRLSPEQQKLKKDASRAVKACAPAAKAYMAYLTKTGELDRRYERAKKMGSLYGTDARPLVP